MNSTSAFRLRWVLPDPQGERAVDALGTNSVADRIADQLLPHLSGQTWRARYVSFLCWAVRRTAGRTGWSESIHRLEAELALKEAENHRENSSECPRIVGRVRAAQHLDAHKAWPARPERLYKSTAFATYRPLMRGLRFLDPSRRPTLTEAGETLARAFRSQRGCLSETSVQERSLIRSALGFDGRTSRTPAQERRSETASVTRPLFWRGLGALEVLEHFREPQLGRGRVPQLLHQAFAWELISLGLGQAFRLLIDERSVSATVRALRAEMRSRTRRRHLSEDGSAARASLVANLRKGISLAPDQPAWDRHLEVARTLVANGDPLSFILDVVRLHRDAKPEGAWVHLDPQGRLHELVPAKAAAYAPGPRGYRLDAFKQILSDLGELG